MAKIIYKVAEEWSAPTFYDIDTNEVLDDECNASVQALWVASYDPEEHEIIEWLERFYPNEEEEAKARAEELNREGE